MANMAKQMDLFALGGLKDEGGEIDEASGNRVPIGGTKEGVRDDIPANVSEGEFVFPADVVRYHGLDKMMAMRQEAKMGLRKMESMGQMGNSEEATMSDDMPFDMADLIVVGGQGEPMEFAEGGFVPQRETLQTAAVPTMGGGTTGGTTTTPIVYDDFMKTPVVTMQEYRNAAGETIIITSVNGKATTEIPAGYTLYTPPTNTAPSGVQAVIQTANNYSYQTSGGGEGPDTPRELQVDPDYGSMNNDTYFSTMERQNSFGGKAGNAAAMGIALAMGPLGLLTIGMLQADKKRQLTSAEQRIASETNPTKKKAYQATFTNMGGKTKEPEEENALVEFGKGFLTAVGGLFGFGNDEVETVARTAGSAAADNTNVVSTAPERSLRPQLRPTTTTTAPKRSLRPQLRPVEQSGASDQVTTDEEFSLNQSDAMQTRDQAQIALDKLEQKRLNEQSVAQPLPANQIMSVNPVGPTGNTGSVSQGGPIVADDVVPSPITKPEVITTKTARPKPGDAAPITLPPADALPLLKVKPIAQAAGTPTAGYDRQPVAQTDMQMGIDPKNIYPTEEQLKLSADVYNTNAQYRQIMGDSRDPRYMAVEDSEVQTDSTGKLLPVYGDKKYNSLLGEKYPASTEAATNAAERGTFQPDYTTGTQTDAAFGPQTEFGRRIANARGDSFTQEPSVRTAGLGDSPDMFGPEISPYSTIPSADPVVTEAAAVTETNTGRIPRVFKPVSNISSREIIANEAEAARFDQAAQATAAATALPMNTFDDEPFGPKRGVDISLGQLTGNSPTSDLTREILNNRLKSGRIAAELMPPALEDPRETINPDPMNTGTYSNDGKSLVPSQISDSQLELGRARNAMPDPYTDALFDSYAKPSVKDQTANAFSTAAGTVGGYDEVGTIIDKLNIIDGVTPTSTTVADEAALVAQENARLKAKPYNKRTEALAAKRTSKGTRKAAPTGDDRVSQANFLERALGITPAKVGARRGNDGVLYRTQGDKREADNRQLKSEQTRMSGERYNAVRNRPAGQTKTQARLEYNAKPENAKNIYKKDGGSKESSKAIVCTEMYRQTQLVDWQHTMKIWHVYQEKHLTPYHQVGYHWLFKPYVRGMKNSSILTKLGAALAKHRTEHLRYILTKGKAKDNLIGNVWCKFVHPLVYIAGIIKEKIGK